MVLMKVKLARRVRLCRKVPMLLSCVRCLSVCISGCVIGVCGLWN